MGLEASVHVASKGIVARRVENLKGQLQCLRRDNRTGFTCFNRGWSHDFLQIFKLSFEEGGIFLKIRMKSCKINFHLILTILSGLSGCSLSF